MPFEKPEPSPTTLLKSALASPSTPNVESSVPSGLIRMTRNLSFGVESLLMYPTATIWPSGWMARP